VPLKKRINDALLKTTGYELRKAEPDSPVRARPSSEKRRRSRYETRPGDRLVEAPVFVLCTLRSGSTLLRVLLNSHSKIHAPHELHLRYTAARLEKKWSRKTMTAMGLDEPALTYLLWDRILHRELTASGKEIIVDKTPNNVFMPDRIRDCWPEARFVFLLRHPAAVAASRREWLGPNPDDEKNVERIRQYCEALEEARRAYDGLTVRYEDTTEDPATVTRRLCEFLDVEWEPEMVEYGKFDHGPYRPALGDWSKNIQSGQVQKPKPPPPEIPAPLRPVSEAWGYAGTPSSANSSSHIGPTSSIR
jgi:hypothetical protein